MIIHATFPARYGAVWMISEWGHHTKCYNERLTDT